MPGRSCLAAVLLMCLTTPAACTSSGPGRTPSRPPGGVASAPSSAATGVGHTAAFCRAKAAFDAVDNLTPNAAAFTRYVHEARAKAARIVSSAPPDLATAARTLAQRLATLHTLAQGTAAHSDPGYAGARQTLAQAVDARCGYHHLRLRLTGARLTAAPAELRAGPASVLVANTAHNVRTVVLARLRTGVTPQQLLAHPDTFEQVADVVGAVVAGPNAVDGIVLRFVPAWYVAFDPERVSDGVTAAFRVSG